MFAEQSICQYLLWFSKANPRIHNFCSTLDCLENFHEFRFSIVRIVIIVSKVKSLWDCQRCQCSKKGPKSSKKFQKNFKQVSKKIQKKFQKNSTKIQKGFQKSYKKVPKSSKMSKIVSNILFTLMAVHKFQPMARLMFQNQKVTYSLSE